MVSGSKLKCPSKVSWESLTFSLLQCNLQQLFGKCTGRDEKCGKMWKNALVARFYILLIGISKKHANITCPRLYVKDMEIDFLAALEKNFRSPAPPRQIPGWIHARTWDENAEPPGRKKRNSKKLLLRIFQTSYGILESTNVFYNIFTYEKVFM